MGGSGAGGTITPDLTMACMNYAQANCNATAQCSPYVLTSNFGSMETCIERSYLFCKGIVFLPGNSWNETTLNACADGLNTVNCDEFKSQFFRGGIFACRPLPGSLADGSACSDASQCQGAYCKPNFGNICGTCVPRSDKAAPCNLPLDCADGLTCLNGTCVPEQPVGAMCVPGQMPCAFPLACRNNVCEPSSSTEGTACDPNMLTDCDGFLGLYCDPQTLMCKNAQFAGTGEPCGFMNGQRFDCAAAGSCDQKNQPNLCMAPSPDGGSCDPQAGPGCMLPAFCINNLCTVQSDAQCGL